MMERLSDCISSALEDLRVFSSERVPSAGGDTLERKGLLLSLAPWQTCCGRIMFSFSRQDALLLSPSHPVGRASERERSTTREREGELLLASIIKLFTALLAPLFPLVGLLVVGIVVATDG